MKKLVLVFLAACNSPKPAPAAAAPPVTAAAPVAATPVAAEPPAIPLGTKMKCAVTGEDFTVSAKTVQVVYDGKRYAFCCADCLPEFNKNPAKFARN
jgi:YHS domain-containing protein